MARYIISQKYFSMRERFTITNDSGYPCFQVEGKFFSLAKKMWIYDMSGREIYFIKGRLAHLLPTYDILRGEERVARITRRPALFVKRMRIATDYGNFKIKGNAFAWDFTIEQEGRVCANISKKVLQIADAYTLDVAPGMDDALMLAAAILVDVQFHPKH